MGHDVPCPGAWVLVATDGQNDMPLLDDAEIPLITPGQRAKVSEAWIDNADRGRADEVPSARPVEKGDCEHGGHQDVAPRTEKAGH